MVAKVNDYDFLIANQIKKPSMSNTITTPNIDGNNTQNQLQVITLVSLSTINTIVSKPKNPIPPDEDDDETFAIVVCFYTLRYLLYS